MARKSFSALLQELSDFDIAKSVDLTSQGKSWRVDVVVADDDTGVWFAEGATPEAAVKRLLTSLKKEHD